MSTALIPAPAAAVDYEREKHGAAMLLKSGLAPQGLKSPEAAMFVILVGRDLGLSPTQSLRSINVISGKVEVAADMQLALFKRAGGRATWLTLDAARASLELTHPNGDKHTETFTMADAKLAGLAGPNWSKYPKAMLRSRCITAGMKSIGFDALAGVYSEGEIGGEERTPLEEPETVTATMAEPKPDAPSRQVVDAEVVDTATGEVIEAQPANELESALNYVIEFGYLKNKAIREVPLDKLRGSVEWCQNAKKPEQFTEFVAKATLVLDATKTVVPGEAPANNPDRHNLEVPHPALVGGGEDTDDDLPF